MPASPARLCTRLAFGAYGTDVTCWRGARVSPFTATSIQRSLPSNDITVAHHACRLGAPILLETGAGIDGSRVFTPREMELISIAFDASFTHMYAPGVRRHIKGSLAAGATMEEVMEILKLCVAQ